MTTSITGVTTSAIIHLTVSIISISLNHVNISNRRNIYVRYISTAQPISYLRNSENNIQSNEKYEIEKTGIFKSFQDSYQIL